jgi:RNA polymerase sigma-70 factor (ECF subfamily)
MDQSNWLAQHFEDNRGHLRGIAYRILGSLAEADDAVQETWIRLSRSDPAQIENLRAWLTTVVARVCLDMLRSRKSRGEDSPDEGTTPTERPAPANARQPGNGDPEQEAMLADSVGLALLVVLDRLNPAERLAFVLHDVFGVSFDEIATIVDRTPDAARQLASRARRRVQGSEPASANPRLSDQCKVVDAFLTALRAGDFEGLMAVLDPDVIVRIDEAGRQSGAPAEIRGARAWAKGAVAFSQAARATQTALIDGSVGAIWAPRGKLVRALRFTIDAGRIVEVEIVADPVRLAGLDLAVL